jgi:predicted nucleic acid-binding protein
LTLYLADTSAWHRSGATKQVADRWAGLLEANELSLCSPIKLELLYSARGRIDYVTLAVILDLLPELPFDDRVSRTARRAQARLAERSQHRGPRTIDLLIAAIAEVHDTVLLHYDRHFDAIARVTGQPTEWLARRGSLD